MLHPDPLREPRLQAIIANLEDRISEADQHGWLGEVDGLQVSLAAARQKLDQMRKLVDQPPWSRSACQRSGGGSRPRDADDHRDGP